MKKRRRRRRCTIGCFLFFVCRCFSCFSMCCCCIFVATVSISLSVVFVDILGERIVKSKISHCPVMICHSVREFFSHAAFSVNAISTSEIIYGYFCDSNDNITKSTKKIDEYLLDVMDAPNVFSVHHIRLIDESGMEVSRVDISHDSSNMIVSDVLFDASSTHYHLDFLNNRSLSKVYISEWSSHIQPPNEANSSELYPTVLPGDHGFDHEFEPIPHFLVIHSTITCHHTHKRKAGYVILNFRLRKALERIREVFNGFPYPIIIIDKRGEYHFHSVDSHKEFQIFRGEASTFGEDFSLSNSKRDQIIEDLFFERHVDEGIYFVSGGGFIFGCDYLLIGDHSYVVCSVVPSFISSLKESPYPIIIGVLCILNFCLLMLCCYHSICKSRKFQTLCYMARSSRPRKNMISPRGLVCNEQLEKTKKKPINLASESSISLSLINTPLSGIQSDALIICTEIVPNIEELKAVLDPAVFVCVLQNLFLSIDHFAEEFNIVHIKTYGLLYLGYVSADNRQKFNDERRFSLASIASPSTPGRKGSSDSSPHNAWSPCSMDGGNCEDEKKIIRALSFAVTISRYFHTFLGLRKKNDNNEKKFEIPKLSIGISCGSALFGNFGNGQDVFGKGIEESIELAKRCRQTKRVVDSEEVDDDNSKAILISKQVHDKIKYSSSISTVKKVRRYFKFTKHEQYNPLLNRKRVSIHDPFYENYFLECTNISKFDSLIRKGMVVLVNVFDQLRSSNTSEISEISEEEDEPNYDILHQ